MEYRLMNDYSVGWPFWATDGLCDDGDPQLPASLAAELRAWAATFNQEFDYMTGWRTATLADEHEREGRRLYEEVKRALPNDSLTLEYWETALRDSS
jgi:hypothetical protein